METKIKEAMKVSDGKLVYCVVMEQETGKSRTSALHAYIYNGKIKFNDSRCFDLIDFKMDEESHRVAKEIFLTHLQTDIKTRLLELKQLELILNQLGLTGVIRNTIVDNGSLLLNQKDKIIESSIKKSDSKLETEVGIDYGCEFEEQAETVAKQQNGIFGNLRKKD